MARQRTVIIGEAENKTIDNTEEIQEEQIKPETSEVKTIIKNRVVKQYLFAPAPMGKCQTNVKLGDNYIKIILVDKIFTPTEEQLKEGYFSELEKYLYANGFTNVSYNIPVSSTEEKIGKIKKTFLLGHPENTPSHKIEGTMTVNIDDKIIKIEVQNGCVKTESEKIYRYLIQQGWYEYGIETEVK